MFDPPKVRKVKILKLLWGFFRRQFAYFCLFWHLNQPRPPAQWVRPNFFGPEGGQTIPSHHSIAKYLKNLKLISRTGTFILRHCVKYYMFYSISAKSCPLIQCSGGKNNWNSHSFIFILSDFSVDLFHRDHCL